MPPQTRIRKEDIVNAALGLIREKGEQALNARNLAAALGCSTQPLFSNFGSMDDLRLEVLKAAEAHCRDLLAAASGEGCYPAYKAMGMAYIRFAAEEKELFRFLYMRDREREAGPVTSELTDWAESVLAGQTGMSQDTAALFHLEMWAFVHGIAVLYATGFLDLREDLVSRMVTDVYQGLLKRFERN